MNSIRKTMPSWAGRPFKPSDDHWWRVRSCPDPRDGLTDGTQRFRTRQSWVAECRIHSFGLMSGVSVPELSVDERRPDHASHFLHGDASQVHVCGYAKQHVVDHQ